LHAFAAPLLKNIFLKVHETKILVTDHAIKNFLEQGQDGGQDFGQIDAAVGPEDGEAGHVASDARHHADDFAQTALLHRVFYGFLT
jgi:hypothetical protein